MYSLAIVPWIKPAQRLFKDEDLPQGEDKRALYEISRESLLAAGYVEIGMDHFALPTDGLALAAKNKNLHRNFMGYTNHRTDVLLGLGVSSISETADMFHQNEKVLPTYQQLVGVGNDDGQMYVGNPRLANLLQLACSQDIHKVIHNSTRRRRIERSRRRIP